MYGYRARSLPGSLASSNGDWTGAVSLKRMWRSSTSALYLARSSRDIRRTSSAHMTVPTAKLAGVEGVAATTPSPSSPTPGSTRPWCYL